MTDFSTYLFRCHSLSKIMTEPKTKEDKAAGKLSVTTQTYLKQLHREERYNRRQEYSSKYIEKGLTQEENAITLLSRVKKRYLKKNTLRVNNKYLTGSPDLFSGLELMECEEGWDTKCSWDIFTFPYPDDKLDKSYYWQNQGYMGITGARRWTTAYCLVNAPAALIHSEKKAVWYKMGCPPDDNEDYLEKVIEVEKNLIFNMGEFMRDNESYFNEHPEFELHCTDWHYDLPLKERVMEFVVQRNDEDIQLAYSTIEKCRTHMQELENQFDKQPFSLYQ